MALTHQDIEAKIASSFGNSKDGKPFPMEKIEPLIRRVKELDEAKTRAFQEAKQKELERRTLNAKRGKFESEHTCPNPMCKNTADELFEKDERLAQVTCRQCGTVVKESQVYDGEWARQFEGEVNPGFHGKPPDPRFGSAYNLATGMANQPGSSNGQAKELALMQNNIEMNLSKLADPTGEKRTRQGYKDKEKLFMFEVMEEVSGAMQLHRSVVARAQTLFSTLRDETEQLNGRFEHGAACLILAFREKREDIESNAAKAAKAAAAQAPPVFLCKYCKFDFSLKRDRDMHQRACDSKPSK